MDMHFGQMGAIKLAVEEGLRKAIDEVANNAYLNSIPDRALARAILMAIVQSTSRIEDVEALIRIHRKDQS